MVRSYKYLEIHCEELIDGEWLSHRNLYQWFKVKNEAILYLGRCLEWRDKDLLHRRVTFSEVY